MTDWHKKSQRTYAKLTEHAAVRSKELSVILRPYIEVTDCYGELACRVTLILGQTPPQSKRDEAQRDLMADVFDFLHEARLRITEGKLDVAYLLARRAYESLSLMVACFLQPALADQWIAGKKISNSKVRKLLAEHPLGEPEQMTQQLYSFFSQATHPNRELVAHRFLGEGNRFVLGAVGKPCVAMSVDHALKTMGLWFWFGAFITSVYSPVLVKADPGILENYHVTAKKAQEVVTWLTEQFNHVLAQEQEEFCRMKN